MIQSTHWEGCWKSHLECAKARITELERELAAAKEIKKRSENLLSALRCAPMSWPQKQIKALYEAVSRTTIDAARKEGK